MRSKQPLPKATAVDPATTFAARYGDGQTASRIAATVQIAADGLLVTPADAPTIFWPFADIRSAEPIRNRTVDAVLTSRKAECASIYVDDTLMLALLAQRAPHIRLGSERWRTARPGLAVGATALAAYAGIWAFDLSPTKGIARTMPEKARTVLGNSVITTMPAQRVCSGTDGRAALGKLTRRLMPKGPITADDVIVLDWSLVNAFAVPGNRIVLTRALIEQAKGPDEIAAVLGHEAGHSIELHPEASLVRAVGFWALVQMVFTGTPGAIGNIGVVLAQLGYTRSAEREADGHALQLLKDAHISPKPMADFFRRMDQRATPANKNRPDQSSDILSSHPSNPERVARIESQPPYPSAAALSDADWKALKSICVNDSVVAPAARPTVSNAKPDADAERRQAAAVAAAAEATRIAAAKEIETRAAEQARAEAARKQAAAEAAEATAKAEAAKAKAKAEAERLETQKREAAVALEVARVQAAKDAAAKEQLARIEAVRKEVGRIDDAIAAAEKAQAEKPNAVTNEPEAAPGTKPAEEPARQQVANATGLSTAPTAPAAQQSPDARIGDATRKITSNAADASALIERGQALAAKKEWSAAVEDFSRALAIKPQDGNTLFWRAAMYAQLGQVDLATNDYSEVIRLQPRNYAAFNNRGSLYRSQKKLDLALRDYTSAIAIDGKQAIALTNRALIHRERNNLDAALADLNAAVVANPAYTNAYVRRGETLELRSQRDAAVADYRAVLRFPEVSGVVSEPHKTARARLTSLGVKF